ncbi:MAG: HNH endonuclease [Comamonas sp.]|jgi:hypothetical protein|uniref:HNH endonuclease n=1 Tax=Comamonas sp. TaxID=34028 RepID=UPI0028368FE0|nr:HNH endonuclease [Comamonas sp.]MDR0215915.1 HNH endonuclease [Comamonas sp.]
MRRIFVFTAGRPEAREHLQISIHQPVPFSLMDGQLPTEQTDFIKSLLPGESGFYAWGAVPGDKNKPTWDLMQPGDLVLTAYDNKYHFISTVVCKFHNPALARNIWDEDDKGRTWEFMYVLTKPQAITGYVPDEQIAKYLNKAYFGYVNIADGKILTILRDFGSLDNFVQTVFHRTLPPPPADQELVRAKTQAETTPPFNPKDLVDGRNKVVQEVVRRQGQPKFRRQLLDAYEGRCAVTGCEVEAVLEAAHIAPYLGKESNAVQNGLLLRADIHTLFDLGQLKIKPTGDIELSEKLFGTVYEELHGKTIRKPSNAATAPSIAALELKFGMV